MIVSVRKLLQMLKFMVLFVVLTFLLYHVMTIITGWIEPTHKYREPAGRAVKAFQGGGGEDTHIPMKDRLMLFYWYGE